MASIESHADCRLLQSAFVELVVNVVVVVVVVEVVDDKVMVASVVAASIKQISGR